jgi:TolB-like protein/Tfp pilus assembly protein PilF
VKDSYRFGDVELIPVRRRLLVAGKGTDVGPRAFDVLLALVERAGELVTKDELLARAWPGVVVEENNLAQQVVALRKILGNEAIATIPGRGYQFTMAPRAGASGQARRASDGSAAIPSIAVLPFEDRSAERDQEFFADGLAEEVLNTLARVRGLRVVSRTSAFRFKGERCDIATIARALGVAWVLEGSVRKSSDRIRVAAQLINAETDAHAWSATYDRDVRDLFAVQDEIAKAVVKEIQPALFANETASSSAGRTKDMEAHRLYLHGRFLAARSIPDDVEKGIAYLESSLEREPAMAIGWATLARAHATRASFAWAREQADEFARARKAAQRAIELDPELAEGHSALAWVRFVFDWDWLAATESAHRALELAPGNAEILREAAFQEGTVGTLESAVALARRAVDLDPLNLQALRMLGLRCLDAGLLDDAERATRDALELFPDSQRTRYHLGRVLALQGRGEEAVSFFDREPDESLRLHGLVIGLHAFGRTQEARAMRAEFIELYPRSWVAHAEVLAFTGDADLAFVALDYAVADHSIGICLIRTNPMLSSLRSDPRWPAFLARINLR